MYLKELSIALERGSYRPMPCAAGRDFQRGRQAASVGNPGGQRPHRTDGAVVRAGTASLEREFLKMSYGFRPGLGCKDALGEVERWLKEGYSFVVDADLKSYFDTIDHERLMERVKEQVSDGRVLELIEAYLHQDIIKATEQWTPVGGTPQGAVISPLLANIYLHPLDCQMRQKGYRMVRYADDFVVLCRSAEQARAALAEVKAWVEGKRPES